MNRYLPVLASATASIITGIALVATRFAVRQADGLTIATLRYLIASSCLLPLVPAFYPSHVGKRMKLALSDMLPVGALGILYFGIFPWCVSAAMRFTTASNGAIILACAPAATLLLARACGKEHLSYAKLFGVAFAILGAALAVGDGSDIFAASTWRGDVLMAIATLLGAVYAVFSQPYMKKHSPLIVTALAMSVGALALSLIWTVVHFPFKMPHLDTAGWAAILYVGIAGGALSFFLYGWALTWALPTTIMILLPLNPIAALIAGKFFLAEPLNDPLFLGLALVIVGIVLVVGIDRTDTGLRTSVS